MSPKGNIILQPFAGEVYSYNTAEDEKGNPPRPPQRSPRDKKEGTEWLTTHRGWIYRFKIPSRPSTQARWCCNPGWRGMAMGARHVPARRTSPLLAGLWLPRKRNCHSRVLPRDQTPYHPLGVEELWALSPQPVVAKPVIKITLQIRPQGLRGLAACQRKRREGEAWKCDPGCLPPKPEIPKPSHLQVFRT